MDKVLLRQTFLERHSLSGLLRFFSVSCQSASWEGDWQQGRPIPLHYRRLERIISLKCSEKMLMSCSPSRKCPFTAFSTFSRSADWASLLAPLVIKANGTWPLSSSGSPTMQHSATRGCEATTCSSKLVPSRCPATLKLRLAWLSMLIYNELT